MATVSKREREMREVRERAASLPPPDPKPDVVAAERGADDATSLSKGDQATIVEAGPLDGEVVEVVKIDDGIARVRCSSGALVKLPVGSLRPVGALESVSDPAGDVAADGTAPTITEPAVVAESTDRSDEPLDAAGPAKTDEAPPPDPAPIAPAVPILPISHRAADLLEYLAAEWMPNTEYGEPKFDRPAIVALAAELRGRIATTKTTGGRPAPARMGKVGTIVRDPDGRENAVVSMDAAARWLAVRYPAASQCQAYVHRIDVLKRTGNARAFIQSDLRAGRLAEGSVSFSA